LAAKLVTFLASGAADAAATLPSGFEEKTVFNGLFFLDAVQ